MSLFQDLEYYTATIASGTALSNAVAIGAKTLAGVAMDSAWTAADLTFQASPDGGITWDELNISDFNAVTVLQLHAPAASQIILFDPRYLRGVNNFKVRSGTAAAPVNQGATRNLTLIARGLF